MLLDSIDDKSFEFLNFILHTLVISTVAVVVVLVLVALALVLIVAVVLVVV